MTYEQLLKDTTEQAELWAKAKERADLLARSEHTAKLLEGTAQQLADKRAEIQALDVRHGERLRELEVAYERHKADLAAALAPLQTKMKAEEDRSRSELAAMEAKLTAARLDLETLTGEKRILAAEVAGLERKKADLEAAWEKVRQKVGAA